MSYLRSLQLTYDSRLPTSIRQHATSTKDGEKDDDRKGRQTDNDDRRHEHLRTRLALEIGS